VIEKGLYTLLAGTSGVTSLVSTRIYPNKAPQNAGTRYIVYRRVMNEHRRHLKGSSNLKRATISIECIGATYDEAKSLYSAVYAAIGENGTTATWDSQSVKIAYWDGDSDDYIPPQTQDDVGVHTILMELVVWYSV
jgi:hypothetical protein